MIAEVDKPLTAKQKLFADFYVGECSLNATRAAEMAGYKGAYGTLRVMGSENLAKPNVRAYIDARLAELTATPSEVLTILTRHAKGSLADLIDDAGHFNLEEAKRRGTDGLLKKLKVKEVYNGDTDETITTFEYEIHDPQSAAVHLGKVHKLFTEKTEHTGPNGGPIETTLNLIIQGVGGNKSPDGL